MWDSTGSDFAGSMAGGFFAGTPTGSQPTPGDKKAGVQRAHNVMPVNIKDILDSPDEKLKIEDSEAHMVTFIGSVEKVEQKPTNVSYVIRDDTGSIEVIQWVEGDKPSSPNTFMEGNFCRVVGSIRQSQDRRHVMAFRVGKLLSANEITTHLLETHWIRLKLRQLKSKSSGVLPSMNSSSVGTGLMSTGALAGPLASNNTGNAGTIPGLTNFQSMVYNIIQATTVETGMEKSQIYNSVKGKMVPRDVDAALEFLCSEGHIYSTVDEDHFKSTDS